MTLDGLMGNLGTEMIWLFVGAGFALVAATLHATLLVQDRPVHPLRMVSGGLLAVVWTALLARIPAFFWPAGDAAAIRLAATTHAAVCLSGPLVMGPVLAVILGSCAFAGARAAPRRWGPGIAVALSLLAAASAVLAGGLAAGDPVYATIRALAYAAFAPVIGAAALAAPSEGRAGPIAAAAGTAAAPLLVGIGEASQRGLVHLLLVQQAAAIPPERWSEGVTRMMAHVAPEWTAGWAALAAASVAAAVGAWILAASGRRLHALATAVGAVAASALLLASADLGPERRASLSIIPSIAPTDGGG